jgi:hypothetical protein
LIDIYQHNNITYFDQRRLVKNTFPKKIENALVYTDDKMDRDLSNYFMQFDTANVRFKYTAAISDTLLNEQHVPVYFLLNEKRLSVSEFEKNIDSNGLKAVTFTQSGYFSLHRLEKSDR